MRESRRAWVRRHRRAIAVSATLAVGLVVFVLAWFQPQKLLLDQRVDEALPQGFVTPAATRTPAFSGPGGLGPTPVPSARGEGTLRVLAHGSFRSLEHATSGTALLLELPTGAHLLRFDGLRTSNGPDLHVYLSQIPAGGDLHAYGERFVDLGKLKGNIGSQNYTIPPGVILSRYRSAVVWCKRFSVGFGVAPLR